MTENDKRIHKLLALKHFLSPYAVQWLIENGFTTAPASTKYHGCYEGGLFDHSIRVLDHLLNMTRRMPIHWGRIKSPYIVAVFHDLCKIDQYKRVENPEDDAIIENGTFYTYEYVKTKVTGHGEKSLIYAESLITLTDEEKDCILYHMGAFGDNDAQRKYSEAVTRCPNVLWTHTADMMASAVDNI